MSRFTSLTPADIALILGTILLLSLGQVLFKSASNSLVISQPLTLLTWPLFAALSLYAVATLAWMVVLSRVPLSVAFPFYGFTFLLVPLFAWMLLSEPVRWPVVVGGGVIMVGVCITTLKTGT